MLGILSQYNRNQGRDGNYYEYELDVPQDMIVEALSQAEPLNSDADSMIPTTLSQQLSL